MEYIGHRIRKKRHEKRLSAESIASRLKKPTSKQAFSKKEMEASHMIWLWR